jgi:deoxyadenosine/deoxycytidine kinase
MKPYYFIVEGNIGAGKSTFLRLLTQYLDVHIVPEPHEKWQNVGGHNLLENFYVDTKRWAYSFQTYAFVTRVIEQEKSALQHPSRVHVIERSVFSDRYCFAKNAYETGCMSAIEWHMYQDWFEWLVSQYLPKPSGIIYLKADPTICMTRLLKRNRSEEAGVPQEYLQQLHDKHEAWIVHKQDVAPYLKDVPVLTLSCDKDFAADVSLQQEHMVNIAAFVLNEVGISISNTTNSSLSL